MLALKPPTPYTARTFSKAPPFRKFMLRGYAEQAGCLRAAQIVYLLFIHYRMIKINRGKQDVHKFQPATKCAIFKLKGRTPLNCTVLYSSTCLLAMRFKNAYCNNVKEARGITLI